MSSGRLEAAHEEILPERSSLGKWIFRLASAILIVVAALQIGRSGGSRFDRLRRRWPTLYAFLVWCAALGIAQFGARRARTAAVVCTARSPVHWRHGDLPDPVWFLRRLHRLEPQRAGPPSFQRPRQSAHPLGRLPHFWNALGNMVFYVATVIVQYAIAFGLALALNADIRGRKFFRVAFLMPFMLSPVAVSWMKQVPHGKPRRPWANFARWLGWENVTFFTDPWIARTTIIAMDAWMWIPFMVILLLAGLQALPLDVKEATLGEHLVVPGDHIPTHAPGERDGDHPAHHLRTQTRGRRHQRHGGRPEPARPTQSRASSIANTAIVRMSAMRRWWPRSISSSSSSSSRCS